MLYFYQSSNPCICSSTPTDPPCPDDCNCLKLCSITVNPLSDDAVGPCGATGSLDISSEDTYGHDFCACGANTLQWGIEAFESEYFLSVSISSAGVLSWTTQNAGVEGGIGCIIVAAVCGNLKVYTTVLVGIKDPCYNKLCSPTETCDPCSGNCLANSTNTAVYGTDTSSNTSISSS